MSRPGRPGQSCACGALIKAWQEIRSEGLMCNCKIPGGEGHARAGQPCGKEATCRQPVHVAASWRRSWSALKLAQATLCPAARNLGQWIVLSVQLLACSAFEVPCEPHRTSASPPPTHPTPSLIFTLLPPVHDAVNPEYSILKQRIARRLRHEGGTDESVKQLTLSERRPRRSQAMPRLPATLQPCVSAPAPLPRARGGCAGVAAHPSRVAWGPRTLPGRDDMLWSTQAGWQAGP